MLKNVNKIKMPMRFIHSLSVVLIISMFLVSSFTFLIGDANAQGWSEMGTTRIGTTWKEQAPLHDNILQTENLSVTYQPIAMDGSIIYFKGYVGSSTTKLYMLDESTGNFTLKATFASIIEGAIVAPDSSLLISLSNASIMRSTDQGGNWSKVLSLQASAVIWNFERHGSSIYAGEYRIVAGGSSNLYKSTNNGVTWATANTTNTVSSPGYTHIHDVYVDPYTNYIYYIQGDSINAVKRSTDNGATWHNWGPSIQPCTMVADSYNIYFGDDTFPRIWIYNKTTNLFAISANFGYNAPITHDLEGSFWDMSIGNNGIIYATTFREGDTRHETGVYMSIDGIEWYEAIEGVGGFRNLIGPSANGWYYCLDADHSSVPAYYGYTHRFKDLTVDEASILIYSGRDITISDTYQYSRVGKTYDLIEKDYLAYDGQSTKLALGQDPINDVTIAFTGQSVTNTVLNGGFETSESIEVSQYGYGYEGAAWHLCRLNAQAYNISATISSAKSFEGSNSLLIKGYNYTAGYIGYVKQILTLPETVPAGTIISGSLYYYMDQQTSPLVYERGIKPYMIEVTNYGRESNVSAGYVFGNTAPTWSQWTWFGKTTSSISTLTLYLYVRGDVSCYVDNVQLSIGMPSPYVAGETNTSNPSIIINGEEYEHTGSLDDGETAVISIPGYLSGTLDVSFSIGGSKIAKWSVQGTRAADITDGYAEFVGDVLYLTHDFNASLRVWSDVKLNPGSWLDGYTGTLRVDTNNPINITFNTWKVGTTIDEEVIAKWTATWDGFALQTYTINGLTSNGSYDIKFDGDMYRSGVKADENGVLSFSYGGTGSSHTIEIVEGWFVSSMNGMMALIIPIMVIGLLVTAVTTMFGKFKR